MPFRSSNGRPVSCTKDVSSASTLPTTPRKHLPHASMYESRVFGSSMYRVSSHAGPSTEASYPPAVADSAQMVNRVLNASTSTFTASSLHSHTASDSASSPAGPFQNSLNNIVCLTLIWP